MTTEIKKQELRDGSAVVIDRTWDRQSRKHVFEVLVVENGRITGRMLSTADKREAERQFAVIAARFARPVNHMGQVMRG